MGKDDFAVRAFADSVVDDEVEGGAGRFLRIFQRELRHATDQVRVDRMAWMNKDNGLAAIELFPDRLKIRVSKVLVACTVACEECDAVCLQFVEHVVDFF